MSKNNTPNKAAQPNAAAEQFRKETEQAMSEDLMTVPALAPTSVAQAMPAAKVPVIPEEITGNSGANAAGADPAASPHAMALPDNTRRILDLLAEGKITADQAQNLLNAAQAAVKQVGHASKDDIRAAVQEAVGHGGGDKAETMAMMGEMVERIVRGLREPSEEEKATIARNKASRAQLIKEQIDMIADQQQMQDYCPHERATVDGKSHSLITALHNYSDGLVRGICSDCRKIIMPADPEYKQVRISHHLATAAAQ